MFEEEFLKKFYRKYLEWVADGCPDANPHGFIKRNGLCNLLIDFQRGQGIYGSTCLQMMSNDFALAHLNTCTPFDDNLGEFFLSQHAGTLHENFKRIKWATDHAL